MERTNCPRILERKSWNMYAKPDSDFYPNDTITFWDIDMEEVKTGVIREVIDIQFIPNDGTLHLCTSKSLKVAIDGKPYDGTVSDTESTIPVEINYEFQEIDGREYYLWSFKRSLLTR